MRRGAETMIIQLQNTDELVACFLGIHPNGISPLTLIINSGIVPGW
jgi:hypothetical protein